MVNASPPIPANETPDVIIIGHQWWWEFQYPKLNITTANELHVPLRTRLLAEVRSADVIHSFWVPQLGPKIDATPGFPTNTWIQADMPGTYQGTCVEYCGAEHANMRITVVAQTETDFNAWVQQQQVVPPIPTSGEAATGYQLFLQLTCSNCHTIAGTTAQGTVAPDLTHVADRMTLGSGVIPNSPAYLASWLADPQTIKPECLMPNLHLTTDQINALVAYLEGNK
jgi:cytochrome c oxidase subunit 2